MVVQFISNLITLNNCPEMAQDHKDFLKKAVKIKKSWFWISEIDRKELKSCEKLSTSHYSVAWRNIFSSNNLTFSFSARLYQFFILLWRNFLPLQFIEFRYSSLEVLHFSWVRVWTLTGSLKSLCSWFAALLIVLLYDPISAMLYLSDTWPDIWLVKFMVNSWCF